MESTDEILFDDGCLQIRSQGLFVLIYEENGVSLKLGCEPMGVGMGIVVFLDAFRREMGTQENAFMTSHRKDIRVKLARALGTSGYAVDICD